MIGRILINDPLLILTSQLPLTPLTNSPSFEERVDRGTNDLVSLAAIELFRRRVWRPETTLARAYAISMKTAYKYLPQATDTPHDAAAAECPDYRELTSRVPLLMRFKRRSASLQGLTDP